MSFRGFIKAGCPKGCDPVEAEVWSFVRGDVDEFLRERLLAGELNLLICETCGQAFYPETTVVYYDKRAELLAFVFPESYRKEAERWRRKMGEDWRAMKRTRSFAPLKSRPLSFFGFHEISAVLHDEDDMEDEAAVGEFLCGRLGLHIYGVDRGFARLNRLPRILPCVSDTGKFSRAAARSGVSALLKANPRLKAFRRWLEYLDKEKTAPPRSAKARVSVKGKRR